MNADNNREGWAKPECRIGVAPRAGGEGGAIYAPSREQLRPRQPEPDGGRRVGYPMRGVTTSRRPLSLNRSNISQLRDDIDAGRTGDKIDWPDPAAVPLGTDEEAAGTPPDPWAVETARRIEVSRPCKSIAHRGVAAAWLLIAFAAALGLGLVAWILWQGGWDRS